MKKIFDKFLNWEAWPFALLYAPMAPFWGWYMLKSGAVWFFTPSNPKLTFGGMEGEPKREMYDLLPLNLYPTTFNVLKKNISLNRLSERVKLFNIGLSNSENVLSFVSVNQNTGLSRIVTNEEASIGDIQKISVKDLDLIASQNSIEPIDIDLIKIDVEGHELEVLAGGKNTFTKMKIGGRILVEIHPDSSNKNAIMNLLKSYSFEIKQLDFEYFLATKKAI